MYEINYQILIPFKLKEVWGLTYLSSNFLSLSIVHFVGIEGELIEKS